jgi:Choline/ethanolamine kinase
MLRNFFTNCGGFKPEYFCIPNAQAPRLIIPVKNKKIFKAGLAVHNTASKKNRIIKELISSSYPLCCLLKGNVIGSSIELNEFIEYINKNIVNKKVSNISFFCGTPGSTNRKLTFLLLDQSGNSVGIIKFPLSGQVAGFIQTENYALMYLNDLEFNKIRVPNKFKLDSWNGNLFLYQENIFNATKSVNTRLTDMIINASIELGKNTLNKDSQPFLNSFGEKINRFMNFESIRNQLLLSLNRIKDIKIPTLSMHGDFVSYNMQIKDGKLFLIDWEFSREGLPLFDIFHFLVQGRYQVKKQSIEKILADITNERSSVTKFFILYLNELGLHKSLIPDLLKLYFFEAMVFDLQIRKQETVNGNHFFKALKIINTIYTSIN